MFSEHKLPVIDRLEWSTEILRQAGLHGLRRRRRGRGDLFAYSVTSAYYTVNEYLTEQLPDTSTMSVTTSQSMITEPFTYQSPSLSVLNPKGYSFFSGVYACTLGLARKGRPEPRQSTRGSKYNTLLRNKDVENQKRRDQFCRKIKQDGEERRWGMRTEQVIGIALRPTSVLIKIRNRSYVQIFSRVRGNGKKSRFAGPRR
jgi:hypothetical protein